MAHGKAGDRRESGWLERARRAPAPRRARPLALVAALLLPQSCSPPPKRASSDPPQAAAQALDVAFSGCERVLAGPLCELAGGQALTLWMATSFRGFELRAGGVSLPFDERPVAGGYQVRVAPGARAQPLSLWRGGQLRWQLALAPHLPSARLALVRAARERADVDVVEAQAAAARRSGELLDAALAEGALARLWLRLGRAEDAAASLERTARALFALGQISEAIRDVFARLFVLLQRSNAVAEARAWLAQWREAASGFPLGRALLADHEGMLLATLGEPVAALLAYREAERAYERLGEVAHARRVRQEQVGLLSDVGDVESALSLAASLMPPLEEEAVCTKAQRFILLAWLTFVSAEEGFERRAQLPEAFAASEEWERRCGDPEVAVTGLVNRGLWALNEGDLALAEGVAQALRELPPRRNPELVAWVLELQGRLALARGHTRDARRSFELEGLIGKSSARLDPELRALLGLAAVADAEGASERGDALLKQAVQALERAQRWSSFGALVYGQLASRQRAARELVSRLAARGSLAEAWNVALSAYRAALAVQARGSRLAAWPVAARQRWDARVAEYREARERLDRAAEGDWQLSSAELRVAEAQRQGERQRLEQLLQQAAAERPDALARSALPGPSQGEYWLLTLPFEARAGGGFLVLGTDGAETLVARVSGAAIEAAQATPRHHHPLLEPFAEPLLRAERIVVLAAGRARALPLETFSLAGQALSKRRLAFGAALGALPSAAREAGAPTTAPADGPRVASVSSDPRGDLPFSRREGSWVAAALNIPESRRLSGPEVTGSRLLEQLETSDFFHFAGHAQLSGPSQEAALLLASGGELQPWELFGLRSVPREVVLSACEAGEGSTRGFGVGWGLAQAFLALGAETVVAPVQRVNDEQAFELQHAVYEHLRRGLPLREAFWAALRAHDGPAASFRLFTR